MSLMPHGTSTSDIEVSLVSAKGFWLLVEGKEYFLSFNDYPWFNNARISEVMNVKFLFGHHLRWDDLDVDIELKSLQSPEKYPLIYQP